MRCPACSRPVAMARETCLYCGAALSEDILEQAALAAQRVLETKALTTLEAAAMGGAAHRRPRFYIVIDTVETPEETIAAACGVSVWDTRQWRTASRFRLLKVTDEPADGPSVSRLREHGLRVLAISDETVARARQPVKIEGLDTRAVPASFSYRDEAEGPLKRRDLPEPSLSLIVSAAIQRVKVRESASLKKTADTRLDDALLVHVHMKGEARPLEIDPWRTTFEGSTLSSSHMTTLELIRRLAVTVPHDEGFRNVVPALAPGSDPLSELTGHASSRKSTGKETRVVVLDNVAQFREYSAWRGAVAAAMGTPAV